MTDENDNPTVNDMNTDPGADSAAEAGPARDSEALAVLHAVALVCAEATEEDTLIERLTTIIGEALFPDSFGILLLDEEGKGLHVPSSYRVTNGIAKHQWIPLDQGLVGWVARHGRPRRVDDVSQTDDYLQGDDRTRAELCVPLKVGTGIIGVINTESQHLNAFSEEDERLLMTLASVIATAIEQVRLHEQTRQEARKRERAQTALLKAHDELEAQVRERTSQLELLNRACRALVTTLELAEVLRILLEETQLLLDVTACSVWLAEADSGDLVCQHQTGPWSEQLRGWRLRAGEGIVGWVMKHGESDIIADASEDPRHNQEAAASTGFYARSILAVPLVVKREVIGVLQVVDTEPDRFSPSDLDLVQALAAVAASAVDNARLYEQVRRDNEELDAFAHTVAHDLQNPLARVIGFAEFLAASWWDMEPKDLEGSLEIIVRDGRNMNNIVEELLLLAGVRKIEVRRRALNMEAIVAEVLDRLSDLVIQIDAEIRQPASWPMALGHAPWVAEVWVNYLTNALRYGGQPPYIEIGATSSGDMITFYVADNGRGIPPEEQARLFRPFTHLGQVKTKGHGLGLSIVRRIIEKLGGEVGVDSTVGKGSRFWFTLPRATQRAVASSRNAARS